MESDPDDIPPDTLIDGRFRILGRLGSGPGYVAYRARQVGGEERLVSWRAFRPAELTPPFTRATLEASVARLDAAEIEGVNPVDEIGESDGWLWVVREWIFGIPLGELLRAQARLSVDDASALLLAFAEIADAARAANLTGLDLSPRPTLLLPGPETDLSAADLVRRPLRSWPEAALSIEPLHGIPVLPPAAGNHFFFPAQGNGVRVLAAVLCDLLGRAEVSAAQTQPPILPALGEAGNALLRRAWLRPGEFSGAVDFATQLQAAAIGGRAPAPAAGGWVPRPVDLSHVILPPELVRLGEKLAEHIHDVWAQRRLAEGWRHGPARNDPRREHPGLVPYAQLSESEKEYDRATAVGTLQAIVALGFHIGSPPPA